MLALNTLCADTDLTLDRAVAALLDHGLGAVALHRAPAAEEVRALSNLDRRPCIVAVFGDGFVQGIGRPVLVVDGGAAAPDREASLLDLCRRLHALSAFRVALRTPKEAGHHPSPDEIALIRSEVRQAGYWHDTSRGGEQYLEAGARWLLGASFDPLEFEDLMGLKDALPAHAPAVIDCPQSQLEEAVARARSCFRA